MLLMAALMRITKEKSNWSHRCLPQKDPYHLETGGQVFPHRLAQDSQVGLNSLGTLLTNLSKRYVKTQVVSWRNETIGHGALQPETSQTFQAETERMLLTLKQCLEDNAQLASNVSCQIKPDGLLGHPEFGSQLRTRFQADCTALVSTWQDRLGGEFNPDSSDYEQDTYIAGGMYLWSSDILKQQLDSKFLRLMSQIGGIDTQTQGTKNKQQSLWYFAQSLEVYRIAIKKQIRFQQAKAEPIFVNAAYAYDYYRDRETHSVCWTKSYPCRTPIVIMGIGQ